MPTPTGPACPPPTASPPASAADLDTPMARDPLTPRPRPIPLSFTELTDTPVSPTPMELTPTPTPMELTLTPMDTELLPESLATLVLPLPSLPGPPRVSARGVLTLTPLFSTELT